MFDIVGLGILNPLLLIFLLKVLVASNIDEFLHCYPKT